MDAILKKRRTWKRAPIKKKRTLIKENVEQKIEKTTHEGKSALCITYKCDITLKNLIFIKNATAQLNKQEFPFSKLISFKHTKNGYQGIWSFCPGKLKLQWSINEYSALGVFLGKLHKDSNEDNVTSIYKPPIILSLRENYETIKQYLPSSFDNISSLLTTIEKKWPLFLKTGLVHTDLFPNNILFDQNQVSGILQNHNIQHDLLLYDLTSIMKSLYFSDYKHIKKHEDAFFSSYTSHIPLSTDEFYSIPILTSAKLLNTSLFLVHKHLHDKEYKNSYLNAAAISLIHAENALKLYR